MIRKPALGTYCRGFVFSSSTFSNASDKARPTTNSPLQPSETQMPLSSYPQDLPSKQGESPVDLPSATPIEVSAGQCCRSPGFDAHATRTRCEPLGAGVCARAALEPAAVATSVAASSAKAQPIRRARGPQAWLPVLRGEPLFADGWTLYENRLSSIHELSLKVTGRGVEGK